MAASRRTRQLYLKVLSKPSSRKTLRDVSSKHKLRGHIAENGTPQGRRKNWQPKFIQDPIPWWGYGRNKPFSMGYRRSRLILVRLVLHRPSLNVSRSALKMKQL